jgi:hypothetical protein
LEYQAIRRHILCFGQRVGAVVLALALLSGCHDTVVAPEVLVPEGVPMIPPTIYQSWWAEVAACAGRTGDVARVRWFEVPNTDFFIYRGVAYDGYWWEYHHTIFLAGNLRLDSFTVRHEMLHDLLNTGDHPSEYFGTRCGSLVN